MNSKTDPKAVGTAFEKTGCGWVLRFSDRDAILEGVAQEIDEFIDAYRERFGETPEPFTLIDLNPDKAAAFFQTFTGARMSLDTRLMVWMVIMGAELIAVRFDYQRAGPFRFRVTLVPPRGRNTEDFESDNLWDFQVLRHLGLLDVDGVPILDGYYATPSSI